MLAYSFPTDLLSPDAAYATEEQVKDLTREQRRHFGRFTPAFVVELMSASDRAAEAQKKMEIWIDNGALLGWLIDPYKRNVLIYEAGKQPQLEAGDHVSGIGPVEGFVLDLVKLWRAWD